MNYNLKETLSCRQILYIMMIAAFVINAFFDNIFTLVLASDLHFLDLDESQRQTLLGISIWGHGISELISGQLSRFFGPRRIIGFFIFLTAIITTITPQIAQLNYHLLLACRFMIGVFCGVLAPCLYSLAANWSPSGRFLGSLEASFFGIALSNFLGGFLISQLGWKNVFYTYGSVFGLWVFLWFLLIYDKPDLHPRITQKEKDEIYNQITEYQPNQNSMFSKIPWRKILTSKSLWAITASEVTTTIISTTMTQQLPSYINQIFKLDIETVGVYSSIPFIGKFILSVVVAIVTDRLIQTNVMSTLFIRKLTQTFGLLVPSLCMLVVAFFGDIQAISLPTLTIGFILTGACIGGHLANILDLTKNFSGTVAGLIFALATFSSFLSPMIVGMLLQNGHTIEEWKFVFWMMFAVGMTGYIPYLIFAESELQEWDRVEDLEEDIEIA